MPEQLTELQVMDAFELDDETWEEDEYEPDLRIGGIW